MNTHEKEILLLIKKMGVAGTLQQPKPITAKLFLKIGVSSRHDLVVSPFTPKSDQFQISPAASPEILHHTVWRTWLFIAYSDERCATNSHYHTFTFSL